MTMAQDAIGLMFEGVAEKDYPAPTDIRNVDMSSYPADSFTSYVCFDKDAYDAAKDERSQILSADNPVRELLNRRHMKIKQLSDLLGAPYRTVKDWCLQTSKPPDWVLRLVVDKVLS